jgi:hypothetical protein
LAVLEDVHRQRVAADASFRLLVLVLGGQGAMDHVASVLEEPLDLSHPGAADISPGWSVMLKRGAVLGQAGLLKPRNAKRALEAVARGGR